MEKNLETKLDILYKLYGKMQYFKDLFPTYSQKKKHHIHK